jgi:septal ring factor EnvC (AmiA/AmiB activator)
VSPVLILLGVGFTLGALTAATAAVMFDDWRLTRSREVVAELTTELCDCQRQRDQLIGEVNQCHDDLLELNQETAALHATIEDLETLVFGEVAS